MLHITKNNPNIHKKVLASELLVIFAMLFVFSASASKASDITSDMVINLVNKARLGADVAALKKNDLLQKAAEQKAQDMINQNYFAHVSPKGTTPWNWIDGAGYSYLYAGENLAINFTNAEQQQKAWMDSPTHRKNILNANYQEIGVAVERGVIDGHETIVTVQEFGTRMPETVASAGEKVIGSETAVAGAAQMANIKNENKIDIGKLFSDNPKTLIGWFGMFALALLVVVIDALALVHKRHGQILMFHRVRNKIV